MIMIDSKSGQKAARARASEIAAFEHWRKFPTQENHDVFEKTLIETRAAFTELGDELMACGHHLAEDY